LNTPNPPSRYATVYRGKNGRNVRLIHALARYIKRSATLYASSLPHTHIHMHTELHTTTDTLDIDYNF